MDSVKEQSASAKWYEAKLKNNTEFYAKEKKRVAEYMKQRYANDEEYRKRIQEQKKQSYYRRKSQAVQSMPVVAN